MAPGGCEIPEERPVDGVRPTVVPLMGTEEEDSAVITAPGEMVREGCMMEDEDAAASFSTGSEEREEEEEVAEGKEEEEGEGEKDEDTRRDWVFCTHRSRGVPWLLWHTAALDGRSATAYPAGQGLHD